MSAMAYLISVIWLVTVCGFFAARTWKHGLINPSGYIPPWWPYGDAGWLAYCRSVPTCYVATVIGCVSLFFGSPVDIVGVSVTALGGPIALAVILFNRPQFLVPPARRNDPGLFGEWLKHRGRNAS